MRPGLIGSLRLFGRTFWTAIGVELLHCMASYTMSAYLIVYLSQDLGFGDLRANSLAGMLWFLGYFLPILIGALADRFGFRETMLASLVVIVLGYALASRVTAYPGMVAALLLIALGGAVMKPVIAGTVKAESTDQTRGLGFSIYYMMINVGSLGAPFLANAVRTGTGKPALIFVACAAVEAAALLLTFAAFRNPSYDPAARAKPLPTVFSEMVQVLGNVRALVTTIGLIAILLLWRRAFLPFDEALGLAAVWVVLNLVLDAHLRARGEAASPSWLAPQRLGDLRLLLFILIFSGVWALYSQIWTNIPLFIIGLDPSMKAHIELFQAVDPVLIVCFQVLIGKATGRFRPLPTMVAGILIAAAAVSTVHFFGTAFGAWAVALSLAIWAVGEMLFSPRMVEYVSVIAPKEKLALYIGYGFLPLALGFGLGPPVGARLVAFFDAAGRPAWVWYAFGLWAALNAAALWIYDRAFGGEGDPG